MSIIEILEMAGYSAADLFKRGTSIGNDHDFFLEKKLAIVIISSSSRMNKYDDIKKGLEKSNSIYLRKIRVSIIAWCCVFLSFNFLLFFRSVCQGHRDA